MEREEKIITKKGNYEFGDNYELIFKDKNNNWLIKCNITCRNNCEINCGDLCNITCGHHCIIDCGNDCQINCGHHCIIDCGWHCIIDCGWHCYITSGNDCEIFCRCRCYIKAGESSQLKPYDKLIKTISKSENLFGGIMILKLYQC